MKLELEIFDGHEVHRSYLDSKNSQAYVKAANFYCVKLKDSSGNCILYVDCISK